MTKNYKTQPMIGYLFNKILRKNKSGITPFDLNYPNALFPPTSKIKRVNLIKISGLVFYFLLLPISPFFFFLF